MDRAIEKMIKTAHEADCPRDQVENLVESGYIPLPWQWEFHAGAREADKDNGPTDIGLGGARGPGKSHATLSQAGLDDCQRIKGLKCLFLRQTGISAKESFEDLIEKTLLGHVEYTYSNNVLRFPNRSRILLGGFRDERDIDKYIGIEYDLIVFEELNQVTRERIDKLKGSLRTSKPNWRPRIYTSFNPGGIGHAWVKEQYIVPYREAMQRDTRFYPSTYKSNPFLNKEYITYLENLKGDLGRAWREGEWDLFAGQYFPEWSWDVHTVEAFEIPEDWRRFVAIDYGYTNPSCAIWFAIAPDGALYAYRELYETNLTYSALTEQIVAHTPKNERISYWVADPSIWAKRGEVVGALSGADIIQSTYKELMATQKRSYGEPLPTPERLILVKGNNDRMNGWAEVREYIKPFRKPKDGPNEERTTARLQVFRNCHNLIKTVPSMVHDEHKVEDLDTDAEDHAVDALRYGIMSKPTPAITEEKRVDAFFKKKMWRNKLKSRIRHG